MTWSRAIWLVAYLGWLLAVMVLAGRLTRLGESGAAATMDHATRMRIVVRGFGLGMLGLPLTWLMHWMW